MKAQYKNLESESANFPVNFFGEEISRGIRLERFKTDGDVVKWFDENYLPPLLPIEQYNHSALLKSPTFDWLKKQWLRNPENEAWYQVRLAIALNLAKEYVAEVAKLKSCFDKSEVANGALLSDLRGEVESKDKKIVELASQLFDRELLIGRISGVLENRKLSANDRVKNLRRELKTKITAA